MGYVVLANFTFALVFQGLALWAACVILAWLLPLDFSLGAVFRAIAKPALGAVAFVTPAVMPATLHAVLTAFWLLSLRVVFYVAMASYGLLPKAGL